MAMTDIAVMRLADMWRVHPQQDNSRVCAKCGEQVGIYPSGQEALRRFPAMRIVCVQCIEPHTREVLVPGALDEPFESVPAAKAYRDARYPERACDRCGGLYRGPAVYCSLDCAVADA